MHPSLHQAVTTVFEEAVAKLFGNEMPPLRQTLKPCSNPNRGDFQFCGAMKMFSMMKQPCVENGYKSPLDVANAIIHQIGNNHSVIMDLKVQGPGLVSCKIQPHYLQQHFNLFSLTAIEKSGKLNYPAPPSKQTCVVDFSSPNIAKELQVGHLRSTIIGEAICRILEAAGHTVHRINHVGDWGTPFGKLIQYLKEHCPEVVYNDDADVPSLTELTSFYQKASDLFKNDETFKKNSQLNVVHLQSGDPIYTKLWLKLCDLSRTEFNKIYSRLDISCEEVGESFYHGRIPAIIEEFENADMVHYKDGAKCVFVGGFQFPLFLQKADGAIGYDTTDLAALRYRLFDLEADRIIVVTDEGQSEHFQMIDAAGRDIGWLKEGKLLEHIGFGTINGEDGKKLQTRTGENVRLVDLLDEAVFRMKATLHERIESGKSKIDPNEVDEVAEPVGYGAVKYFDMRNHPTSG